MKNPRLDQLLSRFGFANETQNAPPVEAQKQRDGRSKFDKGEKETLTQSRLLRVLSEQHGVPPVLPTEKDVDHKLLACLPPGFALEFAVLPLRSDGKRSKPTVAIADPGNDAILVEICGYLQVPSVEPLVAPEAIIRSLAARLAPRPRRLIELPELFDLPTQERTSVQSSEVDRSNEFRPALMVTAGASSRNYLPPIFAREGWRLHVVSNREELLEALRHERFEAILVAQSMAETFTVWSRELDGASLGSRISVFSSVSSALIDNPAPYERTARSAKRAVEMFAELRCEHLGLPPSHRAIARDAETLAHRCGLRQLAIDGLAVAAHLLRPEVPLTDVSASLDLARYLGFPWRVDQVIERVDRLLRPENNDVQSGDGMSEILLAAQILALVCYRHVVLDSRNAFSEESSAEFKRRLRGQAGRLASLELIEAYVRMIEENGSFPEGELERQIVLIGESASMVRQLMDRLRRIGYQPAQVTDLADAQSMIAQRHPAAIILDHDSFPKEAENVCRVHGLSPQSFLYVVTTMSEPVTTLALLDAGADDVFSPPHDFDLIVARLDRAVRARATRSETSDAPAPGQLAATLEAFSLIDLLQSLGHGLKSVRVDLLRNDGERAVVFLRDGRLVHAVSGTRTGEEAMYHLVSWGDEGSFVVIPESRFPKDNIERSLEAVLMEACRILDESHA